MQDRLDQSNCSRGQNASKSEDNIEVLSGEGDRFVKSLRDRSEGIDQSGDSTSIEVF